MIELMTIDGERIDLASSAITIELTNTFFTPNNIFKSGFSYPIQLANTTKNRRIFKFFDLLETDSNCTQIPVFMRLSGKFHSSATLQLAMSATGFSGHLKLEEASVSERLEHKLTDIPFLVFDIGTIDALWVKVYATRFKNNWREIPYTFLLIKNNDFFTSSDGGDDRILNNSQGQAFLPNSLKHWAPTVPYFYLCYVLENIAKYLNLSLGGDFAQHVDVQKLVIANPIGFGTNHNIKLSAKYHLPSLLLKDFLKELSLFFGLAITTTSNELNISFKKSAIEQPDFLDWTAKEIAIMSQEFSDAKDGFQITTEYDEQKKDEVVVGKGKQKMNSKVASLPFCINQASPHPIPEEKRKGALLPPGFSADPRNKEYYVKPGEPPIFPLRLIFCHNDGTAKSSNTGSCFNLTMSGKQGLFEFAHSLWMEKTHAARVVKARVLLNAADLYGLNEQKIIRVKSSSGAVVECLWRRITYSISEGQKMIPVEVELVVLNPAKI